MYIANAGTSRYIKVRMNICTGGTAKCKYLRGIFALVATARRRQPRPPPPSTPPCTSGSRPSGRCSPVGGFLSERKFAKDGCEGYLPRILRRLFWTHPSLSQASFLGLGEVFAVGCAGGGLDHGGLLEFKIIDSTFSENLSIFLYLIKFSF